MDRVSKDVRSQIMSSIRGKDTRPEIILRQLVLSAGYRYRKNYRIGNKTIDLAFTKKRIAVMVDGCFWHGCPYCYRKPKSNKIYWNEKLRANKLRDKRANLEIRGAGWTVMRIWEHEINRNPQVAVRRLISKLVS